MIFEPALKSAMSLLPPTTNPFQTGDVALVDSEHAQLSDNIWNALGLQEQNAAVAIRPAGVSPTEIFPSFVCWAKRSSEVRHVTRICTNLTDCF